MNARSRPIPATPRGDGFESPSRVAFVISSLGGGGAQRVLCTVANHLANEGRAVSVITLASPEKDAYDLPSGVRRISLDQLADSRHVVEALTRTAARIRALRRAYQELAPDAVLSFLGRTNVLALLAAAGTGVPVFVCERSDPWHERIGAPWEAFRRLLYPHAAGVIVQTSSAADWARRRARRVHVIPNAVARPALRAAPGEQTVHGTVIAVGRLEREKGFDLLIEAFARIASRHPAWIVKVLGEGGERRRLEALATDLGVGERVVLPGRVVDPVPHLAGAHVFALPSRYEGIPNAMLEAMATGLPVVAFDSASGARELVEHGRTGLLVAGGDVDAFAEALDRLLSRPEERLVFGNAAVEAIAPLAPDRVLRRWSEVLAGAREASA